MAFPDWDAAQGQSRPLLLYCDACQDGFGAVLEQQQHNGFIPPITFLSCNTTANKRNWLVMDLEASAIVWANTLRPHLFSTPFNTFTDHKALMLITSGSEHCPRISHWLEILSAYPSTLAYRKDTANDNVHFYSRLPQAPTKQNASEVCHLAHLKVLTFISPVSPALSTRVSHDNPNDVPILCGLIRTFLYPRPLAT